MTTNNQSFEDVAEKIIDDTIIQPIQSYGGIANLSETKHQLAAVHQAALTARDREWIDALENLNYDYSEYGNYAYLNVITKDGIKELLAKMGGQ